MTQTPKTRGAGHVERSETGRGGSHEAWFAEGERGKTKLLIAPTRLGELYLRNRTLMAPITRTRVVPRGQDWLAPAYYAERASAGLIVSEPVPVSERASGYADSLGLFTDEHVEAWSTVTRAVHEQGGMILAQLWHAGRLSLPEYQPGGADPVAPSSLAPDGLAYGPKGPVPYGVPRTLTRSEIPFVVDEFAEAARRAKRAGFDGVEVNAGDGYLIDQFLRDGSNSRTDCYGGTIAKRSRFLIDVLDAVTPIWRGGRVGVRLSLAHERGNLRDSDPVSLAKYLSREISAFDLAYLHIVEAVDGPAYPPSQYGVARAFRNAWPGALVLNGGYDARRAEAALRADQADAISFGAPFIANPDLPERLRSSEPLDAFDRSKGQLIFSTPLHQ
ncbi:MAG: alkene reductase [Polyangiaceae bacterium]|nr:alkene reductase [Polyangiaceae bacterium]